MKAIEILYHAYRKGAILDMLCRGRSSKVVIRSIITDPLRGLQLTMVSNDPVNSVPFVGPEPSIKLVFKEIGVVIEATELELQLVYSGGYRITSAGNRVPVPTTGGFTVEVKGTAREYRVDDWMME